MALISSAQRICSTTAGSHGRVGAHRVRLGRGYGHRRAGQARAVELGAEAGGSAPRALEERDLDAVEARGGELIQQREVGLVHVAVHSRRFMPIFIAALSQMRPRAPSLVQRRPIPKRTVRLWRPTETTIGTQADRSRK